METSSKIAQQMVKEARKTRKLASKMRKALRRSA